MNALDRAWLLALCERRVPRSLDRMLRLVTHAGGFRATSLISAALLVVPGTRRLGLAMVLANAASHLIVQALKRSVVRPRPESAGVSPLAMTPDAFSFPSGHACAAAALAVTVSCWSLAWAIPAVALALLVGISRVYLRVHYVTDVVVGQVVGSLTALLVSVALW